jgi:hypothetical protein
MTSTCCSLAGQSLLNCIKLNSNKLFYALLRLRKSYGAICMSLDRSVFSFEFAFLLLPAIRQITNNWLIYGHIL